MSALPAANLLAGEASPYLLQHKDNPVHWRPWGEAALAEAKATGKPILLSVGYAACHWCHVMAHECFESAAIAAEMNRRFVNVKVDREERPDVDALYQNALALLGTPGGWPLTMFLTPAGEPFWGGTYFPPQDKWGKPGFARVLARIDELYRNEKDKIGRNVASLKTALAEMAANVPGPPVPVAALDAVAAHFLENVDLAKGGLAGAPKFPQPAVFELVWRAWRRGGEERLKAATVLTLDRMADGGIYDHLGGGFARYSTDAEWLVPHFEKMLYDNAQLVRLYALAWQETRSPLYAERVAETIAWLAREMRDPAGGFYAALDADSEGEEGKFYVWSEAEIDAALGPEAASFKFAYDVTAAGNWEGRTILHRGQARRRLPAPLEARLAAARAKLLALRDTRIRPGLDDKVLADWNGLAIAALARAARIFERPDWLALARGACDFVAARMSEGGRLKHAWRQGRLQHPATLDDYAAMAEGALALFEAAGDERDLARARHWMEIVERHYRDPARGGYFLSADDVADLPMRGKTAFDNATPSGNGTLALALARLHYLTGEAVYRDRCEALLGAFAGDLEKRALGMPSLLMAHELLEEAVEIVVAGPDASARAALARAAWQAPVPTAILRELGSGGALPRHHPAHGKTVDAGAAAFVCRGRTCSLPIADPPALAAALAERPGGR